MQSRPFWEPGWRPRPAPPWPRGSQPRRGRRVTPAHAPFYHPTQTYSPYQYMHNPYYQYDPNYQFYGSNCQLYGANFQSFQTNYQSFGTYNQAAKQAAQSSGNSNVFHQQEQQATVDAVQARPPASHCSRQVPQTIAVNPQPPAAHQASLILTNKPLIDNNASLTSDPPPAHQQAPAQVVPKPPDPDLRQLAPYRPQSQQLAILPKSQDINSKNSGVSHALRRRNEEKAAETKTRYQTLSQWPLASQAVCQPRDDVLGGTQVMYQPDTQTLEAQIVYQPSTDTYASAQIIYQPRTNTLAASHLLYQPQTDKIATAEAVYRPQADDEIMMTTRQTNYEPQANEITTTEAFYQPKADCISSRRVCIQTQTDEVTTTETIYRPQANILAAREMNFQPQKNEIRATEGVCRPDDDIQAKRQTKVCLQNNEVKTTEAIYRPGADILNTKVINFQPEKNVIKTTETVSHPRRKAESNFYSSSDKNWDPSTTETRQKDGRRRKNSTNANRAAQKEMQGSNTTPSDMSAPSLLRQILRLERNQEELQSSSMSRQNMKALEQLQQKSNTPKTHSKPDETTPPKKSLRETRKRKWNTTQAITETAKSSSEETVLTASEWLARLDSLASAKSTSLLRQEGHQQSKSGFINSSTLQTQHRYYATPSPPTLYKEPVPQKTPRQTRNSPKTTKPSSSSNTTHKKTEEPTPSSIPMSWYQLWSWEARCQVISYTNMFINYMHYKNVINNKLTF